VAGFTNSEAKPSRRPKPPKSPRPNARALILNAAEDLFGQRGIAGISLREIGIAAGQRNNSAVVYHFEDKAGLILALLKERIGTAERTRRTRIEKTANLEGLSASELLRHFWEPVLDIDADRGRHNFARFLLAYQLDPIPGYPGLADPENYPASTRILDALRAKFSHLDDVEFRYRLSLLAMMTWAAVSGQDNYVEHGNAGLKRDFSLNSAIRMAVAALMVPE
jgi:AcrR family transcriptional regulator